MIIRPRYHPFMKSPALMTSGSDATVRRIAGAIIGTACLLASVASGADRVELADRGRPRAIIVIADDPVRPAQVAALELQHYVRKMTGAELPVLRESSIAPSNDAPCRVLVGESLATRALGLTNSAFAEQEYLIRTRGRSLILMGRDAEERGPVSFEQNGLWPGADFQGATRFTPMGSLYAVHDFLEHCGVRWYLPGEIGEVCPRLDRLKVSSLDRRTRPWTRFRDSSRHVHRDPFSFYGHADPDQRAIVPAREMTLWLLRMKVGGSPFACNHSLGSYPRRFGATHPEWWKEGKPTSAWPHPDYANPDLIAQVTRDALDYFGGKFPDNRYPDGSGIFAAGDYFAVMPDDGRKGIIWSDAGEALRNNDPAVQDGFSCGWASDMVFNMVRQVAAAVAEKHPGKMISCAAYGPYAYPPRNRDNFPANVAIQSCGFLQGAFSPEAWAAERENLMAWSGLAAELYTWEYYLGQMQAQFTSFPHIYPRQIARAIRCMREAGVRGMFFEASAAPARPGGRWSDNLLANPAEDMLNHYVTWKMLVNASLDVDGLLDEHFRLFYGPAEKPMRAFFTQIEQRWLNSGTQQSDDPAAKTAADEATWTPLCPGHVLDSLRALIVKAEAAATAEPYRSRVRLMRAAIFRQAERNFMRARLRHAPRARLAAVPAAEPPTLDGRIDDAAWKNAVFTRAFTSPFGEPVADTTRAAVASDASGLYLALNCGRGADREAVTNDRVTVILDAGRTRTDAMRLTIDAAGRVVRERPVGTNTVRWTGEPAARVAAQVAGWTAEVHVPFGAAGADGLRTGEVWGLNFQRDCGGETSQWSPTLGDIAKLSDCGVLYPAQAAAPETTGAAPAVFYDFETIERNAMVPDRAGGASPASLRLSLPRTPWSESNLVSGVRGKGLRFGGPATGQYLGINLGRAVNVSEDDFTIAFRCKPEKTDGVLLHSTTSPPYWGLILQPDGHIRFAMNSAGGKSTTVAVSKHGLEPENGEWHGIVMMFDRGRYLRVYLDGELTITHDISGQRGPLKKVVSIGGPYDFFQGCIDEFAIYQGTFPPEAARTLSLPGE